MRSLYLDQLVSRLAHEHASAPCPYALWSERSVLRSISRIYCPICGFERLVTDEELVTNRSWLPDCLVCGAEGTGARCGDCQRVSVFLGAITEVDHGRLL